MSEEKLAALLARLKDDAVALAKEAGLDISKADWLKHQAK